MASQKNQEIFNALADLESKLFYARNDPDAPDCVDIVHRLVGDALRTWARFTGCKNTP